MREGQTFLFSDYPNPGDNSPEAIAKRRRVLQADGTLTRAQRKGNRRPKPTKRGPFNGIDGLAGVKVADR